MRALYLYNSREYAAIDFFAKLKPLLESSNWEVLSDFERGLQGTSSIAYGRLAELIRAVDAIIYAVGPLGPGPTQADFEAPHIVQAHHAAISKGRPLKVVPVLLAGAPADKMPTVLSHFTVQMDHEHRGTIPLRDAVYCAVVGTNPPIARPQRPTRLSREDEIQDICEGVIKRASRRGMTLFVGPYAASDVHSEPTPHFFGSELLQLAARKAEVQLSSPPDQLIGHPWLAAGASRALRPSYELVWEDLCTVIGRHLPHDKPLPLHERIAEFAAAWQRARADTDRDGATWNGLLVVTMEQCCRLETALWEQAATFGRLSYSYEDGCFVYDEPKEGPELKFSKSKQLPARARARTAKEQTGFESKPILLLKLLGCVRSPETMPMMDAARNLRSANVELPAQIARSLAWAPFVMLGGGLLNPLVTHAFVTQFEAWYSSKDSDDGGNGEAAGQREVPRIIVFHNAPGRTDDIRNLELDIDGKRQNWPRELFPDLQRIDWPLPELVTRFTYEFQRSRRST